MSRTLFPDKKLITKTVIVSFISSLLSFASLGGFVHFIVYMKEKNPNIISTIWFIATIAFFVTWIISIPFIILWIKNLKFIILEDRVVVHKGILTKIQKNIPLRAVTDFILERSLFDRILGIGTIKVQTAGQSPSSSGYEGKLSGLLEFQSIHEELRQQIGKIDSISENFNQTVNESILQQILEELKEIKKNTAND